MLVRVRQLYGEGRKLVESVMDNVVEAECFVCLSLTCRHWKEHSNTCMESNPCFLLTCTGWLVRLLGSRTHGFVACWLLHAGSHSHVRFNIRGEKSRWNQLCDGRLQTVDSGRQWW